MLLVATIATTIFAGYTFAGGRILDGVAFAVALLGILGVHETAHYYAARKHGVKSTLPYFIPAPIETTGFMKTKNNKNKTKK